MQKIADFGLYQFIYILSRVSTLGRNFILNDRESTFTPKKLMLPHRILKKVSYVYIEKFRRRNLLHIGVRFFIHSMYLCSTTMEEQWYLYII